MNNISLTRCLNIAAGLCLAANLANAASQLTFTDKWTDALVINTNTADFVSIKSSFNTSITLPLDGVDLSEADTGTMFSLRIGRAGATVQIISDILGDSENWSAGKKSATFIVKDTNTLSDIGTVTVSWTATTISVTGSVSETSKTNQDLLGEEQLFASQSDGTNASYTLNTLTAGNSLSGDFFVVAVTLDASDNNGGTFNYDNPFVPVTGSDKETDVVGDHRGPDTNGDYPLEAGSITGTADFTPPSLTITSPLAGFKVYDPNPIVNLEGRVSDGLGVNDVEYYVNGNSNNMFETDQFPADSHTNSVAWTAEVNLKTEGDGVVGSNVITVLATDTSGKTTSASRTFVWVETNFVNVLVNPPNAGKITGLTSGQELQVGSTYAVTAKGTNKDWIFEEWIGDLVSPEGLSTVIPDRPADIVISSNATFDYFDSNNANVTLQADFVPNPFNGTGLAGTYTGLFNDTNVDDDLPVRGAGYVTLSVTSTGAFTGRLYDADYNAAGFSLSGQLAEAPDGTNATATLPSIKVNETESLDVYLQVATDTNLSDPGAGMLTGEVTATVSNTSYMSKLQGELSRYNTNIAAGVYHVVIDPATNDPAQGPGGFSYGSANVSKTGGVALTLNLADGTTPAFTFSTSMAQDGTCPLYASLYNTDGMILGWMQFDTNGTGEIFNGSSSIMKYKLIWVKKSWAGGKSYTNGFMANLNIFGHLYVPPKAGTNIFGWKNGEFIADGGYSDLSLPDETNALVNFDPNNNTFTATNNVTITFTPTTGAMSGSFYPAANKVTFAGVVVPSAVLGTGYGFYTDTNKETGPISISAVVP